MFVSGLDSNSDGVLSWPEEGKAKFDINDLGDNMSRNGMYKTDLIWMLSFVHNLFAFRSRASGMLYLRAIPANVSVRKTL